MPLPKDIIVFSIADWDHPFWTNNQHVALGLGRRGFRILYVESLGLRRPTLKKTDLLRILRRFAKALIPLRRVRKNIWVFSPLVLPFHNRRLCRWLNDKMLLIFLRLMIALLRVRRPIIWTYNPLTAELANSLPHSLLIYHMVDDLTAAPHMPAATIRAAQQDIFRLADLIFPTSRRLQSVCSESHPDKTHYFPNVADFDHFSRATRPGPTPFDLEPIPRPRIGFVGAISDYKVDFDLIAAVARAKPDWQWILIGPIGQGQPKTSISQLGLPNIHLLGPKEYQDLPDYLRAFDVATLPCPINDYTRSMFPMTFFEYLAAGKPVVATNLDALQEYFHLASLCCTCEEFIQAIEQALAGRAPDLQLRLSEARRHTWQSRLDQMLRIVEGKF